MFALRFAKITYSRSHAFSSATFAGIGAIGAITVAAIGLAGAAPAPSPKFYPGVSEFQSLRAHETLMAFYNGNLPRAERLARELDLHESAEALPPLSRLLLVAMYGLTLQRDDAGTPAMRERVRAGLDSAADAGLRVCRARVASPQSAASPRATCQLIEGGIRGFRAILALESRAPTEVLSEGLEAVSLLEQALASDSSVRDAHLGLGIFHAMAASNTPRVVRGMLRAAGRGVNFAEGLNHLRRSGYEGQYTTVASQFFLIRFLSPYDDELRREKTEIFRTLRAAFPLSPLAPFLQNHEALVFYPDSFFRSKTRLQLSRTLRTVEARDDAGQRYVQLLKYHYALLELDPKPAYLPDTAFDLGGYAFYPEFMAALRLRREIFESDQVRQIESGGGGSTSGSLTPEERSAKVKQVAEARKRLLARLRKTPRTLLNPQNRGLYEWHVSEALRPEQFATTQIPKGRGNQSERDPDATGGAK